MEIERAGDYFIAEENGKYDIFDREGNPLLTDFDNMACNFVAFLPEQELIVAECDGRYGVISFQGEVRIPFLYEYIDYDAGAEAFLAKDAQQRKILLDGEDFSQRAVLDYSYVRPFVNGQAVVCKEGKYGIIDREGNLVLPVSYDKIGLFENGAYWYQVGSVSYLYDRSGELMNQGTYRNIAYKGYGYLVTAADYREGLLDLSGKEILETVYSNTYTHSDSTSGILILQDNENAVIIDSRERQGEALSERLQYNEITPKNPELWKILMNGSFMAENKSGDYETFFTEWNGSEIICRILDLGHTGEPVLYIHTTPYLRFSILQQSYSGFFVWKEEEAVCLLSGYESGGSGGGNYMCLWYDREEEKLLLGDFEHAGGFMGYATSGSVYDYEDGELSLRVSYQWIGQSAGNYKREELLENAELYYDGDQSYTRETILDADAVEEYSVNGELTTIERYREVTERYRQILLPE